LLVPGLISAAAVAALFAYPLAILLPRLYWIVSSLATVMVVLFQYESLSNASGHPLTLGLSFYELACLLVLVPLLIRFLFSIFRKPLHAS
jgi:hypothetical protein